MNDYGKLIAADTLYFERVLQGTPDRVWEYLTDSELRGKWLASGEMEPKVGGKVELHFHHPNLSDEPDPAPEKYSDIAEGSKSNGVVTEFDPPRRLSFLWGNEGEVTFELEPLDGEVLLKLTHRKLSTDKETRMGTLAGWHTHLNILRDHLLGRATKGFWKVHMPLEEVYSEKLDKKETGQAQG